MTQDWEKLRKILVEIYKCASAWDNDDGKMAEANEKTPEDILFAELEKSRQEERERIIKELEKIRGIDDNGSIQFVKNIIIKQLKK